jgi:hypothetical protein
MIEIIVTLIVCVVAGFVVGVGVLATQDFPKLGEFLKNRPVIGWTLAFLAGGITVSALLYILELAAFLVLSLMIGSK